MVKLQEKCAPEEFHAVDPDRIKTKQDNTTKGNMKVAKVPVMDHITMTGKIGGIDWLLKRLVNISCEVDISIRIVKGRSFLTGCITVYRGNMLDVIEHLLREIDLLVFAIAHGFNHQFEVNFTCKQTIKFSLAA